MRQGMQEARDKKDKNQQRGNRRKANRGRGQERRSKGRGAEAKEVVHLYTSPTPDRPPPGGPVLIN